MKQKVQNKQIPKNWKQVVLKEILDYEQPNPYIISGEIQESGKTPVLTANKSFIKGYTEEKNGIFENTPAIIFDDFTTDNKFVNFPFKVKSSAMKILKPRTEDVDLKFIFYQMQIQKVNTTTHKRYYLSNYQNLTFLLPSIEEQNLIVQEIEKQFTRLDAAVKVLKAVKEKLEIYRKAVLKKAFDGKIISFDKMISGKLSEFVDSINSGYACGKHSRTGSGIIHFRPYNIDIRGNISFDSVKIVDPNYSNKRLEYGDVVFNNTNSQVLIGKTCHYDREENIGFSNHMTQIKVKKDTLDFKYLAKYLHFLYLSGFYYKIMKSHVNQSSVNIDRLSDIDLTIPSLEIQHKIIEVVEGKLSVIDKIQQVVEASLEKAEKLRKSILKSAFEGKLIKMGEEVKDVN